jgi:hypothetical protein
MKKSETLRIAVNISIFWPIILIVSMICANYRTTFKGLFLWIGHPVLTGSIIGFFLGIIPFLKIFINRNLREEFGNLELRLIGALDSNNFIIRGSKKHVTEYILVTLLSCILAFSIYKALLNVLFEPSTLNQDYDKEAALSLGLLALSSVIVSCKNAISHAELREHGILYGIHQVRWKQVYDYRWNNETRALFTYRTPKGFATLQATYKGLLSHAVVRITIPESLQSDINQVLESKLPPQVSDVLMIPDSWWNLGYSYKLNHLGITHSDNLIDWDKIKACQWRPLRDCHSPMGQYLKLRRQQKYRILQVEWGVKQRTKHTEIAVPYNLVEVVNEKLTKYLPTHIQFDS